jgi:preprotein translocase subunit SecG
VTVLLVILYVLVCLFLIMVVLLQQGKGADLAGRMTTGAFILFVLLCLTLTILSGKSRTSVMEDVPVAVPVESSEAAEATEPALGAAADEGEPAPVPEPAAEDGAADPEPAGEGG